MTKTLTVEGDLTAADTSTSLTTQGSVTAPSIVIPTGVTKIDKIAVSISADFAADGGAGFFVRLNGNAVKNGEQVIAVGAAGGIAPEAGANTAPSPSVLFILEDVEIDITASDTITIRGEMAGSDLGTARMVVTLIFA